PSCPFLGIVAGSGGGFHAERRRPDLRGLDAGRFARFPPALSVLAGFAASPSAKSNTTVGKWRTSGMWVPPGFRWVDMLISLPQAPRRSGRRRKADRKHTGPLGRTSGS